jgi:hypothetical protein
MKNSGSFQGDYDRCPYILCSSKRIIDMKERMLAFIRANRYHGITEYGRTMISFLVPLSGKEELFKTCTLNVTVAHNILQQNLSQVNLIFMDPCIVMLCFFTTHCSLRLIVRSELHDPTFATRRLHACHHVRAPSDGRWNCGREMSGNFA